MIRPVPRDLDPDEMPWYEAGDAAHCPPADLLGAVAEGVLPDAEAARVKAHVAECAGCRTIQDVLGTGAATLPTTLEGVRILRRLRPFPARRVLRLASAAAVLLLASAGVVLLQSARPRGGASAPVAAGGAEPESAARPHALVLEPPEIDLPPSALTLRGSRPEAYGSELQTALEPFRRGEYGVAARALETVARDHRDQPHAAFYLGVSRLLAGLAPDAIEPLREARRLSADDLWLRAEASWYLAAALERADAEESLVSLLQEVCSAPNPHRDQACHALRDLAAPLR